MRMIYVVMATEKGYKKISEYEAAGLNDCLHDIEANGLNAIDIRFDMEGNIVINVINNYMEYGE